MTENSAARGSETRLFHEGYTIPMSLRSRLAQVIDWTIKRRTVGSGPVYDIASRIVRAYENQDVDMATNGEYWLQARVGKLGPIAAFDVGANQGEWVNGLLQRARDCRVYCYEPVPSTFDILAAKVNDPRATLIQKACSSEAGILSIYSAVDNPYISSVEDVRQWDKGIRFEKIEVSAVTGDAELDRLSLDRLDILKVDAEGHDFAVLLGFRRAIEEGRISIIQFEYNAFTRFAKQSLDDFFQFLSGRYVICRLLPAGLEAFGYHTTMDNYQQANFVAVEKGMLTDHFTKEFAMRPARGRGGAVLRRSLTNEPHLRKKLGLS